MHEDHEHGKEGVLCRTRRAKDLPEQPGSRDRVDDLYSKVGVGGDGKLQPAEDAPVRPNQKPVEVVDGTGLVLIKVLPDGMLWLHQRFKDAVRGNRLVL